MARKYIVIGAVMLIAIGVCVFILLKPGDNTSTAGLIKIKGYSYIEPGTPRCQAVSPSCGVCYGKVIDKACYATPKQFESFKAAYPALEAE